MMKRGKGDASYTAEKKKLLPIGFEIPRTSNNIRKPT